MNQIIKTERLELRLLLQTDVDSIFVLRSCPVINEYIVRDLEIEKNDAMAFIDKTIKGTEGKEIGYWVIQLKENETCIGTICLWNFSEDRKTAEVGYGLLLEFHKKGIMNESLKAVLDFGFNTLKLKTIEAFTHKNNRASQKLLEKNQFIFQPERKDEGFPHNIIFKLDKQC